MTLETDLNCGPTPLITCEWTFSNGTGETTGQQVTHTFTAGGDQTVTVTTNDPLALDPNESLTIAVNAGRPTVTSVSGPNVVQEGSSATFTAIATDPGGSVASYVWRIGGNIVDGEFGSTLTRTLGAGSHTVTASAIDNQGDDGGQTPLIGGVFVNRPPVASFNFSPAFPTVGQSVNFTSTSSDPDGTIAAFSWDLDGNNVFGDATGATASRAYTTSGSRNVYLQVTDNNSGAATSSFASVDVSPDPSGGGTSGAGTTTKKKKSGPKLLSPFPRVRYAGSLTPRGVQITLLYVRVPKGARVTATCARRCPASLFRQRTKKKTRDIRLRSFIGSYPSGSMLRIRVTKANRIGKYTQIYIPKDAAPRRSDKCLYPSSKKPRKCP